MYNSTKYTGICEDGLRNDWHILALDFLWWHWILQELSSNLKSYWHLPTLNYVTRSCLPLCFTALRTLFVALSRTWSEHTYVVSVCTMWSPLFDTSDSSWEYVLKVETIYWIVLSQNYIPQICPHERWSCGGHLTLIQPRWWLGQYALCPLCCSAGNFSFCFFLWLWEARRSHCLVQLLTEKKAQPRWKTHNSIRRWKRVVLLHPKRSLLNATLYFASDNFTSRVYTCILFLHNCYGNVHSITQRDGRQFSSRPERQLSQIKTIQILNPYYLKFLICIMSSLFKNSPRAPKTGYAAVKRRTVGHEYYVHVWYLSGTCLWFCTVMAVHCENGHCSLFIHDN
jgi:hypothetical protein